MLSAMTPRLGGGLFLALSVLFAGWAHAAEAVRFEAEVRRTEYGIPHVKAEDWGGLGYGYGHAYAQDNFCVAMRAVVAATGRSAEFFGEDEGDPVADFVLRYTLGSEAEFRRQHMPAPETPSARLVAGFAAGMNRYLRETGIASLPEGEDGCRDAEWVAPVEPVQLWMSMARLALQASSDQEIVRDAIYGASTLGTAPQGEAAVDAGRATFRADLRRFGQALADAERGSNAIAIGRDLSRSGYGLLLGNPHQPWRGNGSFYQVHLTIPGVYDVAGASLQGMPVVGIGFNRNVAWTHTVSFATRFTLYQLQLHPRDPRQYRYGGGYRNLASKTVEIRVKGKDGALRTQRRTFHRSHYGPLVDLGVVSPLLSASTYSLRDANVGRYATMLDQYLRMGQAGDMKEFTDSLRSIGVPVFHTLAADRDGQAFYGEVASVPHVTSNQLRRCVSLSNYFLRLQTNNAAIALDGSNPYCEWGSDPDSPPGSGLYGYEARPRRLTTDYVANSNDSYWLSNADRPLTGFPVLFGFLGHEGRQQLLRTRIGHLMLRERSRESQGFDLAALKALLYRHRVHAAELVLDDVLLVCGTASSAARRACDVLRNWDRKVDIDSRGAQVFTEFWRRIRLAHSSLFTSVVGSPGFWRVSFDPAQPLRTPRGIDLSNSENRALVLTALASSVGALDAANVALDSPWGEVQFDARGEAAIPIHGGDGNMGVYAAISANLGEGGYTDIRSGNSYIQAVTWDESDCPVADTVLAPSQSSNPDSPHYRDQTALYSRKEWLRFPFCAEQIEAAQIGLTLVLRSE